MTSRMLPTCFVLAFVFLGLLPRNGFAAKPTVKRPNLISIGLGFGMGAARFDDFRVVESSAISSAGEVKPSKDQTGVVTNLSMDTGVRFWSTEGFLSLGYQFSSGIEAPDGADRVEIQTIDGHLGWRVPILRLRGFHLHLTPRYGLERTRSKIVADGGEYFYRRPGIEIETLLMRRIEVEGCYSRGQAGAFSHFDGERSKSIDGSKIQNKAFSVRLGWRVNKQAGVGIGYSKSETSLDIDSTKGMSELGLVPKTLSDRPIHRKLNNQTITVELARRIR